MNSPASSAPPKPATCWPYPSRESPQPLGAVMAQPNDISQETHSQIVKLMRSMFRRKRREVFVVAFIDERRLLIRCDQMFRGDKSRVTASIREIACAAFRHGARAIVVAHNHLGGDTKPSELDARLTRHIRLAMALVGIPLRDHLIFSGREFHSMADAGPWDAPLEEFAALLEGSAAFTAAPISGAANLTPRKD